MARRHGKHNGRGNGNRHRNAVVITRKNKKGRKSGIFTGENDMVGFLDNLTGKKGGSRTSVGVRANVPVVYTPREECWESGIEIIKSCGTAPHSVPVTIGPVAQAKFNALMQSYPRIEWLAYLIGNAETRHVEDIIIPKQEVTSVNVFVGEEGVNVPTIGVIHSHHGMGNGFSGTDHEYINQNHDISLCIAHGGIAGQVRIKTACGKLVIVKADVYQHVEGFNHTEFIKSAKDLIKEKTYTYPNYNYGVNGTTNFTGGGYRGRGADRAEQLGFDDINSLGAESADTGAGINADDITLGIIDLSDTVETDIMEHPTSFDMMDLVGLKEILSEVITPTKSYERFAEMYSNFIDSNTMYLDEGDDFMNPVQELLDAIDTEFESISHLERNSLVNLWRELKAAIDICIEDAKENGEMTKEPEESDETCNCSDGKNPVTGHSELCNCVACRSARAEEQKKATDEWDASAGDGAEDSAPVDVDTDDKLPSDNLWNTTGGINTE